MKGYDIVQLPIHHYDILLAIIVIPNLLHHTCMYMYDDILYMWHYKCVYFTPGIIRAHACTCTCTCNLQFFLHVTHTCTCRYYMFYMYMCMTLYIVHSQQIDGKYTMTSSTLQPLALIHACT